jgi:hypothetical protein
MNREVHVRFWESPEVKVLRATRQTLPSQAFRPMSGLPPVATNCEHPGTAASCHAQTSRIISWQR